MRWIKSPLFVFSVALIAILFIALLVLKPHIWPPTPAPVSGEQIDGALILRGAAFNAPDRSPEQNLTVTRSILGRPLTLRIAVLPGHPPPTPAEQGVRILLTPEAAALIEDMPVTVEVEYRPLPTDRASMLAVSLQGIGPAEWMMQPLSFEARRLRFDLPPQFATNAIGLRAVSYSADGPARGLEITAISIRPTGP